MNSSRSCRSGKCGRTTAYRAEQPRSRSGIGRGKTSAMGAQVLAQPGRVYAIYLPKANPTGELDLSGPTRILHSAVVQPKDRNL